MKASPVLNFLNGKLPFRLLACGLVSIVVASCSDNRHEDLNRFMAEVKSRPVGQIEPIPTFRPYKAFTYSATTKRSPFVKPVEVKEITRLAPRSDVKPDPNRVKEYLERFNIDALALVGTLSQGGELWMLIDDGEGGVHRVKKGNYLGRNHGQIIATSESSLSIIEIVPNGLDGWVERPRTLKLRSSE